MTSGQPLARLGFLAVRASPSPATDRQRGAGSAGRLKDASRRLRRLPGRAILDPSACPSPLGRRRLRRNVGLSRLSRGTGQRNGIVVREPRHFPMAPGERTRGLLAIPGLKRPESIDDRGGPRAPGGFGGMNRILYPAWNKTSGSGSLHTGTAGCGARPSKRAGAVGLVLCWHQAWLCAGLRPRAPGTENLFSIVKLISCVLFNHKAKKRGECIEARDERARSRFPLRPRPPL